MSNEIQLSKYHDADITRIKCSDLEKGLELSFNLVDSAVTTISFPGCQFYRIDGMWKQNIVYRIRSTLTKSINRNEILVMLYNMVRNDSQTSSFPISQIELWLTSIVNDDLILLLIEPSIGAEFMIISKSMDKVKSYAS